MEPTAETVEPRPETAPEIQARIPSIFNSVVFHGSGVDHCRMELKADKNVQVITTAATPEAAAQKALDFALGHTGGAEIEDLQKKVRDLTIARQNLQIANDQLHTRLAAAQESLATSSASRDQPPAPDPPESAPPAQREPSAPGPPSGGLRRGTRKKK